jgi:4'-phosphopantetheinyl transferase
VDVERMREVEALEISSRFLSEAEAEVVRRLHGTERQRAFFSCWTRTESVLKACGEGLTALGRVEQRIVGGCRCAVVTGEESLGGEWAVADLDPRPGYVGALAAHGRDWTLSRWDANLAW